LIEDLLSVLAAHPAVTWPTVETLFDLPAALRKRPEGAATVLMGEMPVRDIPVGLPLDLAGNPYGLGDGQTMAVTARGVTVKDESVSEAGHARRAVTIEVTATNHKNVPVDFEWCQSANWDGTRLASEERKHEARDDCWLWPMRLKPGEQTRFRYVVEESH